jgi:predicted enzyme related to lactoylglutathione lyase
MTQGLRAGAVLYAKHLEATVAFYARVAGLRARPLRDDHVVLASTAFQLVVLRIQEPLARSIHVATPPVQREEAAVKLVFFVDSIAAARSAADALGGTVNPVDREWEFEGCGVCDGHDPEGNVFQLRERRAHGKRMRSPTLA